MAGTIFYRERRKVGEREKKPRFRVVAAVDVSFLFYCSHLRKKELEQIAEATGAELVLLEGGEGEQGEGVTEE